MEGLFWTGMTVVQRTAAEALGHSAATWDLEMSLLGVVHPGDLEMSTLAWFTWRIRS